MNMQTEKPIPEQPNTVNDWLKFIERMDRIEKDVKSLVIRANVAEPLKQEIQKEMCENFCKYPDIYTPDEWEEKYDEVCADCPLNRI